jgi:glycosyltransferase involved in cell wall biosynthesis
LVQNLGRFYARHRNLYQEYLHHLPSPAAKRHIHYVSDMPQAHLVPAYQRADVFVYPSVWDEPFGMPLVEAMACGVPVVSPRSGGIPEFVKDGENGLLVERGNADALGQALMEVLANPERRQRMGQKGRKLVDASLTWQHVARNFLTSIEAVEASAYA